MCASISCGREERRCPSVEHVNPADNDQMITLSADSGIAEMTQYAVFQGVTLTYQNFHSPRVNTQLRADPDCFEICHCLEGRMERHYEDTFYYLTPGDMSVSKVMESAGEYECPLGSYRGISIVVNAAQAPECLSCILDDVDVRPAALMQKFCSNEPFVIMRANESLAHIFSELYSVPDSIRKGYMKVKILELLLFLSGMERTALEEGRIHAYSSAQVQLAKSICAYLTEHMNARVTIRELAEHFNVSETQIKNSFKGVYGDSVYSYIRTQKMRAAALYLRTSDETILEVAGRFGYDNASKFAKAFKDVNGVSPNEFRTFSR